MTNPFADDFEVNPFDADDPFEDDFENARDNFPNADWVIDRLLLVWPQELLKDIPGNTGNTYDSMVCRIVVLDGPPTDDMPKIPIEIVPFRFNADGIIADLKHLVGGKKAKLARLREKPSKPNPKIMARYFAAPEDADIAKAREYMKAHKA